MENASKALIIAGAILLSILIIALGIFIFNAAKGAVNTDSLDATEIETFNQQFTMYEGDRINGSSVKELLAKCVTNAGTNANSAERLPNIIYTDPTSTGPTVNGNLNNINSSVANTHITEMNLLKAKISPTHYYKVAFEYDTTGIISTITISY